MNQNSQSSKTFEVVFSVLILAPILFFLFGSLFGTSLGFLLSLIGSLSFPVLVYGSRPDKTLLRSLFPRPEIESFGFFFLTFGLSLYFCLSWPDFIAIGERLRDYALLASVKDYPLLAKEPWMTGSNLNYYLYWYRFAAYWSSILGLETWASYHFFAAFSFSFFIACIFRLARNYFNIPLPSAICFSLLIAFGSNIDGIINAYSNNPDWWGPSRVIKGTINEFPAWSFLLGDLHPHFFNLSMTLFILCLAFAISKTSIAATGRIALTLLLFTVSAPLYYNSNAWEVPMAGILFSLVIFLLVAPAFSRQKLAESRRYPAELASAFKSKQFLSIAVILILCLISLLMSCRNIQPADYPWRWVNESVEKSTWLELLRHWGIPLILIVAALFNKVINQGIIAKSLFFLFALSLAISIPAVSLLILALCLTSVALSKENKEQNISVLYALGISSLILIALGELVFLDDPYGGENERMNTVFKIYSASWAPLHIFAFVFSYFEFQSKTRTLIALAAIATMPAFFAHKVSSRANQSPSIEGLASVEQEFPGSRETIRFLRKLPRSTMLEAQGNPYSYTSFLSTLGGQDSYLGWANHVGLLTGQHEEVARREKITEEIYNTTDCDKKRELAKAEGINLIAVGHLERQKYTSAGLDSFGCMTFKYNANQHLLVSP